MVIHSREGSRRPLRASDVSLGHACQSPRCCTLPPVADYVAVTSIPARRSLTRHFLGVRRGTLLTDSWLGTYAAPTAISGRRNSRRVLVPSCEVLVVGQALGEGHDEIFSDWRGNSPIAIGRSNTSLEALAVLRLSARQSKLVVVASPGPTGDTQHPYSGTVTTIPIRNPDALRRPTSWSAWRARSPGRPNHGSGRRSPAR